MKTVKVFIEGGVVSFIYGDKLKPFLELGKAEVKRASHVEPIQTADGVRWQADMSPVGGPLLEPCDTRGKALGAEVEWLNAHKLGSHNPKE